MTEVKILSVRQFRDRAAEIRETVQIAVRDPEGNLRILGTYTPFLTESGPNRDLTEEEPPVPGGVTAIRRQSHGGLGYETEERAPGPPSPRMIRTPADATAVAPAGRSFSKAEQAGRRSSK